MPVSKSNDVIEVDLATNTFAQLAKTLRSQSVSLDLEDWEDLVWEFSCQDGDLSKNQQVDEESRPEVSSAGTTWNQALQARQNSRDTLAGRMHGPQSLQECKISFDMKKAVATILNGPQTKQAGQIACGTFSKSSTTAPAKPTVLIHFRDSSIKSETWHVSQERQESMVQVFREFRTAINSRKQDERSIGLLMASGDLEATRACLDRLEITLAGAIQLPEIAMDASSQQSDVQFLKAQLNERRLKRLLRHAPSHQSCAGPLIEICGNIPHNERKAMLGHVVWTPDQVAQAATQLLGRFWRKNGLIPADFYEILHRLGLSGLTPTDDTGFEKRPIAAELVKRSIQRSCNNFEKQLLDGLIDPDKIPSTMEEVILEDDTKEILQCLINAPRLQRLKAGTKPSRASRIRGALLYGPPGTGKTHLARGLAKVTGSIMLTVDSSAILDKWVGNSEKGVKAVFTLAKKLFPCVLFIDEVDALFGRRSRNQQKWERSTANQFLQEMDGLTNDERYPFVLVATNRPQDLDEAFLRRLPHKILVGMPDISARAQILRVLLKDEVLDFDVDLDALAKKTNRYTGSDLQSVCEAASLFQMIEQSKASQLKDEVSEEPKMSLGNSHIERALQKIKPTVSDIMIREIMPFALDFGGDSRNLWARPSKDGTYESVMERISVVRDTGGKQKKGGLY